GRGAEFVRLPWFERQATEKLGAPPFPGTLNLRIPAGIWKTLYAGRHRLTKIADPASDVCPGYGARVLLRAAQQRYDSAWLVIPELTDYDDVLEIIAPVRLRNVLGLADGDRVGIDLL